MSSVLKVEGLALNAGRQTLCEGLNLQLLPGESLAILGRNGTGKTTLLHTLLGLQQPQQGRIEVCGRDLNSWSRKELATRIGILFQNSNDEMPATVLEIALMGRYPHVSGWRGESAEDIALAQAALAQMELDDLAERQIRTLSGGERQRLALAMLLAQAPQLYLLDEPSNHLDIGFQIKVLSTLTQRMQDAGAALCLATHDINLVSRYCDQVLIFLGGARFVHGATAEVLTEENLSTAYGCAISRIENGDWPVFHPA